MKKLLLPVVAMAMAATPALAAEHTVTIRNMAFEPQNLAASVGDTVVFVNADAAPHTATARNGTFDTGRLNRGGSSRITLKGAGALDYFCQVHPGMRGTITVN